MEKKILRRYKATKGQEMYAKLWDLIPLQEIDEKLSQYGCKLDIGFAGFEDQYRAVASCVPDDFIIIDFGCDMAAQAYLFQNHEAYIGVDYSKLKRFATGNTKHYVMSIQAFISKELPKLKGKNIYGICNYVPDEEARRMVFETCDNCLVYYPDKELKVKGFNSYRIIDLVRPEEAEIKIIASEKLSLKEDGEWN